MKVLSTLLLTTSLVATTPLWAKQEPVRLATDARIAQVMYHPNQVVPIRGTPFVTTQIVFAKDEFIREVQNGDLGAWTASVNKSIPYTLFLKPTTWASQSNLTIITNRHTYYFSLSSPKKEQQAQNEPMFALKFIYPTPPTTLVTKPIVHHKPAPKVKHTHYTYSGDISIVPKQVFDDGRFTYMRFAPNQKIPAVFVVDNRQGHEAVVNLRKQGAYMVVHTVAPQFTLRRSRDHVATLFNERLLGRSS